MTSFTGTEDPYIPGADATAKSPTPLSVSGGSRSNLLSLKLSEILSSSYSDSSIRDALLLLGERIQENTPEMRRQFRANVEAEVIEANGQVLEQFSKIAMQLETIGLTIANMNSVVDDLSNGVSAVREQTKELFAEEEWLSQQKDEIQIKQSLLDAVKAHFFMADAEIEVLTSSAEPIDNRFFDVVKRGQRIYSDCEVLLASENPVIGVEIMDQMSKHIDAAFDKLYYWIQREIRHLSVDDLKIRQNIRRALGLLAGRPTMLQNCLDGLSELRQKIILREFLEALTEGPKPIELVAYDPFRYIGDMLAWTHSETVNEKEVLELMFIAEDSNLAHGLEDGIASEPWAEQFDLKQTIGELTDKNMQSICKPLKARIDQSLSGNVDSTLAYRIFNLFEFYRSIFSKYLSENSQLLNVLKVLESSSMNQFHRSLREKIQLIQAELPNVTLDLQPPQFLQQSLIEMKTLMTSFDTSFAVAPENRDQEFDKIIEDALVPYLTCCISMSESSSLSVAEKDIFLINCFDSAKSVLHLYSFTKGKLSEFEQQIRSHSLSLIAILHNMYLTDSKLKPTLAALKEKAFDVPLKSLEQFQESNITQLSIALDDFLPSALMDAQTFLQRLASPRLGNSIIQEAAKKFVDDFAQVEKAIVESIEFPRTVFPRTLAEVRVLLVV
ncbi:oligomeric Golgi complex subunit 6, partial [Lipomyces doorenjongii]|uniref:oligomeric Golgi complex subunit 6 n=1 Tax=Lipomyces doorenjongii TaxID=383834 RepID=UPI0034CF2479